jgi:UDP-N-acetyl-D-mannosaminuronate dehydrogenase
MKVCIIGLGEIGWETFKELKQNPKHTLHGVEISDERLNYLWKKDPVSKIDKVIPCDADIYILSVYTPKQIKDVIAQIDLARKPLVVIESTMLPGETEIILQSYPGIDLVLFPHRYVPNDPEHHVFNLNRIMGASTGDALARAVDFYRDYMPLNLLMLVPLKIAELSKPLENAYRYVEIALAEEIKMLCDKYDIDFETLRAAMNSKWNIDVKEARNGIGLKCLPKDCNFIDKFFVENEIFRAALKTDTIYRGKLQAKGIKTSDYREIKKDQE